MESIALGYKFSTLLDLSLDIPDKYQKYGRHNCVGLFSIGASCGIIREAKYVHVKKKNI